MRRALAALALALGLTLIPSPAQASVVTEHCTFSHAAPDDPILFPGQPGASHLHNFAGNTGTDAFSTPASLAGGSTTCSDQPQDASGYWTPMLYVDGVETHVKLSPYWRDNGVPVVAAPFGMEFVAGHDWGNTAFFACTPGGTKYTAPPDCTGKGQVKLRVLFPFCWDGVGTTPVSFVYPAGKDCPQGHEVHIPQLDLHVVTPVVDGTAHTWELSSGDMTTMHADFMDAFAPSAMQALVDALDA